MAVLACDRQGCENIMCDWYSHTYGYLCYSCRDELVERAGRGITSIVQFMSTPKEESRDSSAQYLLDQIEEEFELR